MRLDDERFSTNFEDRTGRGGGGGLGGFGGGGGMLPMLLGVVASRFGIVGVLILALGYCALTTLGGGGGGSIGGAPAVQTGAQAGQSTIPPQTRELLGRVLGSTEEEWTKLFQQQKAVYRAPGMIAYSNSDRSGCGAAQAAMGPFYCPTDEKIYIDPTFFNELSTRFGAQGDFAQAYVIAHEVGHHIQKLTGTLDQASASQQRLSRGEANAVQVRVELQADCYAGVWAANDENLLEPGDVEEGMRAAEAIGDDTLQRQSGGRVVPESFTHGSSAQRIAWLRKGLQTGDPRACDTFSGAV